MLARQIGAEKFINSGRYVILAQSAKARFAARGAGTGDHGGYQGLAHGQCVPDLHLALRGNSTVDPAGQIEFLPQPVKRRHRTCRNRRDLHGHFVVLPDAVAGYRRRGPDEPGRESTVCRLCGTIQRCGNTECRATGRPEEKPSITYIHRLSTLVNHLTPLIGNRRIVGLELRI